MCASQRRLCSQNGVRRLHGSNSISLSLSLSHRKAGISNHVSLVISNLFVLDVLHNATEVHQKQRVSAAKVEVPGFFVPIK